MYYERLLVPVDLGDPTSLDNALPVAASLAKDGGSEIHVVTVLPTSGMAVVSSYLPADYEEKTTEGARKALAALLKDKENLCAPASLKAHVARGSVYQEIMHAADTLNCDAIVMTAHSPELKDYLLGPNAARVVRHAKQSVMVIRG
ncbi:MAG: universal stress protein [Pseudomonadota bacterium]